MLTGALALLLAAQLPATLPGTAAPADQTVHAWQPTIFSGKRGGWPSEPAPPAIDPATGTPNPVVCRSGGASVFTGRANAKPVCVVESPEIYTRTVTPTLFSGRLASRERTKVQQQRTQYVETRQAYVKQQTYARAKAEASGTAYVPPPPPPAARPRSTVRRPSIFTGRRAKPDSQ